MKKTALLFISAIIIFSVNKGYAGQTRYVEVNMRGVTLDVYAQFFGSLTGKKVDADPRIGTARFTMFIHKLPLNETNVFFEAFLNAYGFVIVNKAPGVVKIVPQPNPGFKSGNSAEEYLNLKVLYSLNDNTTMPRFYKRFAIEPDRITIKGLYIEDFIELISEMGAKNIVVNSSLCNSWVIYAVLPVPLTTRKGLEIMKSAAKPIGVDYIETKRFFAVHVPCY